MSSNKERQARKRAKLKTDPDRYEAHLQNDRKRKAQKLAQTKARMTDEERQKFLLRERLRIRKLHVHAARKSSHPKLMVNLALLHCTKPLNHLEKF